MIKLMSHLSWLLGVNYEYTSRSFMWINNCLSNSSIYIHNDDIFLSYWFVMIYRAIALREHDYGLPYGPTFWTFGLSGRHAVDPEDLKLGFTNTTKEDAIGIFGNLINRKAVNQARDFRTAMSMPPALPKEFYPTVSSWSGEYVKVPATHTVDFPLIRANNQPRYSLAKGANDIVVSDYQKGSITVRYFPDLSEKEGSYRGQLRLKLHELLGLPKPSSANPVKFGGRMWSDFPDLYGEYYVFTAEEVPQKRTIDIAGFMSDILSGLENKPDVVTTAVAAANAGTVDLATSLAEMPLFAKSALNGAMNIIGLYKDAKRRDLRLKDRVKKTQAKYDKLISKMAAKDIAAVDTARRQQVKDVNNLLHEISSVWLNYRLNILPTAMTVESSIDGLVFDGIKKYLRIRKQGRYFASTRYGDIDVLHRATIKRGLISTAEWQGFFTVNLSRTAWELVPLSFVVDRYMNVGDWITANLSSPSDYVSVEGSTTSWMIKDAIRVPGASIDVNLYKRSVFSSDSYCQLTYPTTRSRDQTLDHLALAWSILTKKV